MKRLLYIIIGVALTWACSYDESVELCTLSVQLVYPENTVEPYAGAPIELRSVGRNAVFIDSTDAQGRVRFRVTPDSLNAIDIALKSSRKRVVH